ncbi:DNA polymerase III subunit alpha [Candidatus Izimaplasma bacterium HR1]|jgi:DNA polymerase-3 subunit alpha|uniref:DNA polymerase III subunit alpha n=1 Tax=Candidatus Izimoplasma sp. HR1 TaxID=1541959 RepID=UPI0004F83A00|nr:DNA polymerase III subunit alpha [Candidatus Izimaplasma bacterium HR1]
MAFTHLYVETNYALNGSNIRINELVKRAVSYGYTSLAITDPKMHGTIKFYKACKANNINPVIGLSAIVEGLNSTAKNKVVFLAKSNEGYQNLLKISSIYSLNKIISLSEIKANIKGLITIIISDESELYNAYSNKQANTIREFKELLNNCFDEYYLSISSNESFNTDLSKMFNFVVLPKVSLLDDEDREIHKLLSKVFNIDESNLLGELNDELLKRPEEVEKDYSQYKQALNNTTKIADSCKITIDFSTTHLPKYKLKDNIKAKEYLHALVFKGLDKRVRGLKIDKNKYIDRLNYELRVIDEMGYNDYFLIVWDFVKYAKQNKYLVGPGRGSAAASLVSYCLGITSVDSIAHELVFERFLNPERITLPDIDMDLPDDKRDDVIKYVRDFYGVEKVASICTFGTFKSKSAIRDTARVIDFEGVLLTQLTKESDKYNSITDMVENSETVKNIISQNKDAKNLLYLASKLEGLLRHVSTHAAGIIVTGDDMTNHTPIQVGLLDMIQTQYEAKDLEDLGLLKIDFLGLRNLSSIDKICQLISYKEKKNIDIYKVPLNDQKTFDLLKRTETTGIFQLESRGMRSLIGQMQIDSFEDIVTILALFRPGPMENIPSYIRRRNNLEKITYPHKILEDVLKSTNGIIIYQEQIIQIASLFAGYSLGEADVLRRAVSKKSEKILHEERANFVKKAKELNRDEKTSNEIYDYIVKFANYGFNKAHSVAYAMVSYWMAYLKANYPKYFISILTTSVIGSEAMMKEYIFEANKIGVKILPPSINKSNHIFNPENNNLRFPLLGIKNLGRNTVRDLVEVRKDGAFENYFDFVRRCHKTLNKRVIESLIYAGALDEFGYSKHTMIDQLDEVINFSLYGDFIKQDEFVIENLEEYSYEVLKEKEKSILGFNLFVNPLTNFEEYIKKHKLLVPSDINEEYINREIRMVAVLSKVRQIKTKNNKEMAFITVDDEAKKLNGVLFTSTYQKFKDKLIKGEVYLLKGKIDNRNNEIQLIVNNLLKLDK